MDSFQQEPLRPLIKIRLTPSCGPHWDHLMQIYLRKHKWSTVGGRYKKEDGTCGRYKIMGMGQFLKPNLFCGPNPIQPMYGPNPRPTLVRNATTRSENMRWWNERQIIIIIVIEMSIIKVALSHFCCRTTVQSDSVSVARQVTVRRW